MEVFFDVAEFINTRRHSQAPRRRVFRFRYCTRCSNRPGRRSLGSIEAAFGSNEWNISRVS